MTMTYVVILQLLHSIFIFDTTGPIESKLSKNIHLVVLFKSLYFSSIGNLKCRNNRPPRCQKRAFIFQPILMIFFFKFLIWFSLCNIPIYLVWIWLFSRYKGSQNEVNIKILSYYFKSDLIELISFRFLMKFYQHILVSEMKRVKGSQKWPQSNENQISYLLPFTDMLCRGRSEEIPFLSHLCDLISWIYNDIINMYSANRIAQ